MYMLVILTMHVPEIELKFIRVAPSTVTSSAILTVLGFRIFPHPVPFSFLSPPTTLV